MQLQARLIQISAEMSKVPPRMVLTRLRLVLWGEPTQSISNVLWTFAAAERKTWSTRKWVFVLHFFVEKYLFELSKIEHTSFKRQSNSNRISTGYIPVQYRTSGNRKYLQNCAASGMEHPRCSIRSLTWENTKTKATMVDRKPPRLLWKTIKLIIVYTGVMLKITPDTMVLFVLNEMHRKYF